MASWLSALARTRRTIAAALARVFTPGKADDEESLEDLEACLIQADVPVRLVAQLMADLEKSSDRERIGRKEMLARVLTGTLRHGRSFDWKVLPKPFTVLVVGVNGSGKTTTCAKLAWLAQQAGCRPLLGATDTFRAAGADQLKWWADHLSCDVVAGAAGADAAAVAYDALAAAEARGADVLVVDTAGRMHTRQPLMQELQKTRTAMSKRLARAPDETWIVLDATLGQNAIVQAKVFHEAVPLTGAIISKLDGSAKAGFVFAVAKELNIPILFAGLGEAKEDLATFDPESFVQALLGVDENLSPAAT